MDATPFLAAFSLAFLFTLLLTPLVKRLATRAGALDRPNARKVHKVPTPLWGGLGVFIAFVVALAGVLLWFDAFTASLGPKLWKNLLGMIVGGALIVMLGMIDDRFGMPAKVKLLGQLAIAAVMVSFGIRIDYFSTPFTGPVNLQVWQAVAVTMFWIVGITNAINLLDGLDGLVAGVALGSAAIFLVVAGLNGQWLVVLVMAALAGCALGFLKYNFNPAQIFMGDTGSLFLGLMFAGWSVIGLLKTTATLALAVPVLIMGVPILDTSFAILRRWLAHRPIFQPDKGHLHHRLLGLGLSQRQAVVLIYVINVMFGLAGLALACVAR
ncbi:MAG: undecaprenyl/decaprenyl-phosphate alpha-N-acetylglucosaminyl 1-phosphate transferase [Armatimonadetes bacterium]|nr:undecaprenyl/decaprenyl-phosphate alpha-N-acetylglucosaminyl 1-phosphate transferase [Armatimonadota bacterium]